MNRNSVSLHFKLFWAFALVTVLAALLPALYTSNTLYQEHFDIVKKNALVQATLFKSLLETKPSAAQLDKIFDDANHLSLRVTLLDSNGKVIKDSLLPATSLFNLDNHSDRPEVVEAKLNGQGTSVRYSNTMGMGTMYAAVALNDKAGGGIVRVAMPVEEIKKAYETQFSSRVMTIGIVILVCILLSMLISHRIRKNIAEMTAAVASISSGSPRSRLHQVPGKEFIPLADAVNQMAENIEAYVQTTRDQQTQLTTILNSLYEGVLVLDQSGRVRSFNNALQELFPNIEYGTGKQLIETMPLPELQCRVEEFLQAQNNEAEGTLYKRSSQRFSSESNDDSLHFQTKGGQFIFVHISKPLQGSELLGAVLVFYDATQIMKLEKVRRDFVSNVSHELRTPLTAIASSAEILIDLEDLKDEYKNFAKVIYKHAAMLSRMVSDLLALARVEDYQQSIEFAPLNPLKPLEDALELCKGQLAAKKIRLELEIPENCLLNANGPLLTQVFRNLLENACRYSPEGEAITVKAQEEKSDVLFLVADKGIGIPKQYLPRIFERFYQVEKERNSNATGIGLSICKHIIDRHNGQIWAESPYQDYSTAILFTIPKAS